MRNLKSFSTAAFFIATAVFAFSCQMDDQIEGIQEAKIIVKETVFRFSINHSEQDILSESGTDLSWDWQSVNQMVSAYIDFPQSPTISQLTIPAPWYTQGNPLNTIEKDIYSKDGWVLVMRNFGSSERAVKRPYFGLLNTKTNILKIFIHNSQWQPGHYLESNLVLVDSQNIHSRSFESKPAKIVQFDSWFNLEFQLDQNQLSTPYANFSFLIECAGILETEVG
ncbi:hypothetical protein [Algoriphagus yeomjeoni]|uniref:NigD-like protein n=1 Tax=Algoriphagus yeomjeoni TaxID=291403 RepID=A0A327PCZ4_9BACT|nr:hypothetical protein [Algoriphagus yeomjeoni]RAI90138.1 hypothetical protein LV83_02145 [Algoriphagus yeomjeoni]